MNKTENIKSLILETFWSYRMPEETRNQWLNMASMICYKSRCLEHLVVKNTATTAEQGEAFLQDLADSEIDTLVHVDFSGGKQVIVT